MIDAFPPVLWSSDDFGMETLTLSPEQFLFAVSEYREQCNDGFNPSHEVWTLVEEPHLAAQGVYETTRVRTRDGRTRVWTVRYRMDWNAYSASYDWRDDWHEP